MSIVKTFCIFVLLQAATVRGWDTSPARFSNRMFGSHDASDGQFPYVTFHAISLENGYDFCSGSIIGAYWVLTAGHCMESHTKAENHFVAAGNIDMLTYKEARKKLPISQGIDQAKYNVQERRAAATFQHPQYNGSGAHDIGLVKLLQPFKFNSRVQVIEVSKVPFGPHADCTLIGYGLIEGNVGRYNLQYISKMPANPSIFCRYLQSSDTICLVDITRGICFGDSGGPLVCGGKVVGVASHGVATDTNCGVGNQEQYFIDTEANNDWIKKTRKENKP